MLTKLMNKYKVEFVEKQSYVIDVLAKDEKEARAKATEKLDEVRQNGMDHHYKEGDISTDLEHVYDVTNTDDPFNP